MLRRKTTVKRDAPFEPDNGDFDKFIAELHKNSAHNAQINKNLAEQQLNGGASTWQTIKEQHQNTLNDINESVAKRQEQMKHSSCASNKAPAPNALRENYRKNSNFTPMTYSERALKGLKDQAPAKKKPNNGLAVFFVMILIFFFFLSYQGVLGEATGLAFAAIFIFQFLVIFLTNRKKKRKQLEVFMNAYYITWFVIALVLLIIEINAMSFYLLALSLGALAGGISAYLECSLTTQTLNAGLVTIIASCLSFYLRKRFKSVNDKSNNVLDIGQRVTVSPDNINIDGTAKVIYRGATWQVYSSQGPLSAGIYLIDKVNGSQLELGTKLSDFPGN